ncbi:hypothetical protein NPIL_460451 [Nephila pilipes]|uniref:Uncharacterized protein n=1 Tax=Nephila pilipes TaxID=299642 RepID=A0A8X6PD40_NEPPI|nr:hypothetical protein NPIL_460451 [Nephila pilipes]
METKLNQGCSSRERLVGASTKTPKDHKIEFGVSPSGKGVRRDYPLDIMPLGVSSSKRCTRESGIEVLTVFFALLTNDDLLEDR